MWATIHFVPRSEATGTVGDPPNGRGCVANPPTCGPLLFLPPAPPRPPTHPPFCVPGQMVRDQQFINEVIKQLVVELRVPCQLNTSLGTKPKSSDMKTDLIYKRAFRSRK